MNLCTNAVHAMQEEGGVLEIQIENRDFDQTTASIHKRLEPGPYVALTVSDTGHGIEAEMLQRIFEPYFTTKSHGEGTGLGLSMVHGIVESMAGAIKVYSEPGGGTTFNIYLPRVESPCQVAMRNAGAIRGGSETILLVDDEEMILEMTCRILAQLGYTVVARTSSLEALKAFEHHPARFDLVITDQTMPDLTGKNLAQQMMRIRPDLPIILCTGFSAAINEEQSLSIGIRAFLRKPVLREELAEAVRSVLDCPSRN